MHFRSVRCEYGYLRRNGNGMQTTVLSFAMAWANQSKFADG